MFLRKYLYIRDSARMRISFSPSFSFSFFFLLLFLFFFPTESTVSAINVFFFSCTLYSYIDKSRVRNGWRSNGRPPSNHMTEKAPAWIRYVPVGRKRWGGNSPCENLCIGNRDHWDVSFYGMYCTLLRGVGTFPVYFSCNQTGVDQRPGYNWRTLTLFYSRYSCLR